MLLRLSSLLRRGLDEDAHEVALRQELQFLSEYLEIQRARFGERLSVRLAVEESVLDTLVPAFLLQPLVENAIEHGESDDGQTTILVCVRRQQDSLQIGVEDHGPGLVASGPVREGVGLSNTRARLHHLYGVDATLELRAAGGSATSPGARVDVRIPLAIGHEGSRR
jgi:LytS/YehU family sensor histidine kinase